MHIPFYLNNTKFWLENTGVVWSDKRIGQKDVGTFHVDIIDLISKERTTKTQTISLFKLLIKYLTDSTRVKNTRYDIKTNEGAYLFRIDVVSGEVILTNMNECIVHFKSSDFTKIDSIYVTVDKGHYNEITNTDGLIHYTKMAVKRREQAKLRRMDALDGRTMREKLIDTYGQDYLDKEKEILTLYNSIEYQTRDMEEAYKTVCNIILAQQTLRKCFKVEVFGKLTALVIRSDSENNIGYYDPNRVTIEVRTLIKYSLEDFILSYIHEYGHYIHDYLTERVPTKKYNRDVFNDMVKAIRKTETVDRLRKIEKRQASKQFVKRTAWGVYILSGVELIARLFESYGMHTTKTYLTKEDIIKAGRQNWYFTEQESKILVEYLSQCKL